MKETFKVVASVMAGENFTEQDATRIVDGKVEAAEAFVMDKTTKYLGIKLDPMQRTVMESVISLGLGSVRRFGEQLFGRGLERGLKLIGTDVDNQTIVKTGTKVFGYALAAGPQLTAYYSTVADYLKQVKNIRGLYPELSKQARKENVIFQDARDFAKAKFGQNFKESTFGLVAALPQFWIKYWDDYQAEAKGEFSPHLNAAFEEKKKEENYKPIPLYNEVGKLLTETEAFEKKYMESADTPEANRYRAAVAKADNYIDPISAVTGRKAPVSLLPGFATPLISGIVRKILGDAEEVKSHDLLFTYADALVKEIKKRPSENIIVLDRKQVTVEDAVVSLFEQAHKKRYGNTDTLPPKKLREVCSHIASALVNDGLSPTALIELAGQKEIILNQQGELIEPEKLNALIETHLARSKTHRDINASVYAADSGIEREDLQQIFDDAKGNIEELAMLAAIFPMKVTMEMTGKSRGEVHRISKKAAHHAVNGLEQIFSELVQKPDETLLDMGLNAKEVEALRDMVSSIRLEGRGILAETLKENDEKGDTIKTSLAKAFVAKKQESFTERVAGDNKKASYKDIIGNGGTTPMEHALREPSQSSERYV